MRFTPAGASAASTHCYDRRLLRLRRVTASVTAIAAPDAAAAAAAGNLRLVLPPLSLHATATTAANKYCRLARHGLPCLKPEKESTPLLHRALDRTTNPRQVVQLYTKALARQERAAMQD